MLQVLQDNRREYNTNKQEKRSAMALLSFAASFAVMYHASGSQFNTTGHIANRFRLTFCGGIAAVWRFKHAHKAMLGSSKVDEDVPWQAE